MGGRVNLTKDVVMEGYSFKMTYSNWQYFGSVRQKYVATGRLSSAQLKTLGLA